MRFIELFAGIGGFRFGLESINRKKNRGSQSIKEEGEGKGYEKLKRTNTKRKRFSKHDNRNSTRQKSFTCIWANEWDKYACQIYRKNFGEKELIEGDIRTISAESIPDFDMLTAGFPCQRFSIAGKRKGMSGEDTRGSEFYEIYRIAKVRHPQLLLLENVPGLFSSRGGEDFHTILKSLDEIGYDVEWDCINTSIFLPQNRLRVFIIGHLRGKGGQKVFPIGETSKTNSGMESTGKPVSKCLRARGQANLHSGLQLIGDYRYDEGLRIRKDNICPTIRQESKGQDHSKTPLLIGEKNIRRLTPTECERLQGFPDGWTEGISDTQRYKCLGNAVTTNVVEEIGKRIARVQQRIF